MGERLGSESLASAPRRSFHPEILMISSERLPSSDRPDAASSGPILIVDDNDDFTELMSHVLGTGGYAVRTAATGEEALLLFEADRPAAVLLDLRMPGMDGQTLYSRLRELDASVPIIVVTASPDQDLGRAMLRRGAFDYLRKPVDPEHLRDVVAVATARPWRSTPAPPAAAGSPLTQVAFAVAGVVRRVVSDDPRRHEIEVLAFQALREALLLNARSALDHLLELRRRVDDDADRWMSADDVQYLRDALEPLRHFLPNLDEPTP